MSGHGRPGVDRIRKVVDDLDIVEAYADEVGGEYELDSAEALFGMQMALRWVLGRYGHDGMPHDLYSYVNLAAEIRESEGL